MTEPHDPSDKPEIPTETTGLPPIPPVGQSYPPPGYAPQNYPAGAYPGNYPPPPPPGAYPPGPPYPGYGAPVPAAPKNGLGIAALIVGLLSLPAVFTVFGGFALGAIAVILGFLGYRKAKSGEASGPATVPAGLHRKPGGPPEHHADAHALTLQRALVPPPKSTKWRELLDIPRPNVRFGGARGSESAGREVFDDAFLHHRGQQLTVGVEEVAGAQPAGVRGNR